MAKADREIRRVVRGRDLEATRAELGIDRLVEHDRNRASGERQDEKPARERGGARIGGAHRDRHVAEHRLGARRADDDLSAAVREGIGDVVELPAGLAHLDLFVAQRGLAGRAPVDDVAIAIDEAFAMETDEHLAHGPRHAGIERERLAGPVERGAEPVELPDDVVVVLLFPFPALFEKFLAPERVLRNARLEQRALDDLLRGDPRVVHPREPENVASLEPLPPAENVLHRRAEGVADGKRAGDVRGRQHDRERGRIRAGVRDERAGLPPGRRPFPVDVVRIEYLFEQHLSFCFNGARNRHTLTHGYRTVNA